MDDLVCIDFNTAEFLYVMIGQNNYGNTIRRASACAVLCDAMGKRKMETSPDCFDLKEDKSIGQDILERKTILKFLRSQPGTESLVFAIENGLHYKK